MRELERRVLLSVLDRKWREHLYEMDYLREGIDLRAYSQRDPLVEYQREGFDMFAAMMDGINEETVGFLFNLEVQLDEDEDEEEGRGHTRTAVATRADAPGGPRSRRSAAAAAASDARAAPHIRAKGLEAPKPPAEPLLLRAERGRRGRGQGRRRSPTPTTPTPRSAATRCARAARARSTSGATARRVAPRPHRPRHRLGKLQGACRAQRPPAAARTGWRPRGSARRTSTCTLASTTSSDDERRVHAEHPRAGRLHPAPGRACVRRRGRRAGRAAAGRRRRRGRSTAAAGRPAGRRRRSRPRPGRTGAPTPPRCAVEPVDRHDRGRAVDRGAAAGPGRACPGWRPPARARGAGPPSS